MKNKSPKKSFLGSPNVSAKSSFFELKNGYSTESKLNRRTTAAGNPARGRRSRINLQNSKNGLIEKLIA